MSLPIPQPPPPSSETAFSAAQREGDRLLTCILQPSESESHADALERADAELRHLLAWLIALHGLPASQRDRAIAVRIRQIQHSRDFVRNQRRALDPEWVADDAADRMHDDAVCRALEAM